MLEKRELPILCQASRETRDLDSVSWYCNNAETRLSRSASWSLQWCWDAGFNPRVLVLRWWRWLALRLEFGFCFLMTCLQWFLDSLHVCHVRMGSSGVRALIWTASGMGHYGRLIKIPGGTDCYYCINHMTCSIHVYYCPFIFVTIPDIWSIIMSPVYLVTLSDICYTHTIQVHVYSALHIFCFMYILQTSWLYIHNTVVWLRGILKWCNSIDYRNIRPHSDLSIIGGSIVRSYKLRYYCRNDIVIFLLLMHITLIKCPHVLYIIIMTVLL